MDEDRVNESQESQDDLRYPYRSKEGVLGAYKSYIDTFSKPSNENNPEWLNGIIKQLQDLQNTAATAEQNFYSNFGTLEQIRLNKEEWEKHNWSSLFSWNSEILSKTSKEVNALQDAIDQNSEEEIKLELKITEEFMKDSFVEDTIKKEIQSLIAEAMQKTKKGKITKAEGTVVIKTQGDKYKVEAKCNEKNLGIATALTKYLNVHFPLNDNKVSKNEDLRIKLFEEFSNIYLKNASPALYETWHTIFLEQEGFTFSKNIISQKGWLAEMYWNAYFRFVWNTHTNPVGALLNISGKQLSYDMTLLNTGFQIKSWTFKKDTQIKVLRSGLMGVGSFVEQFGTRLSRNLITIIEQLFGVVGYNNPKTKNENEDPEGSVENFANEVNSQLQLLKAQNFYANNLSSYFNYVLMDLMRFTAEDILPGEDKVQYRNTFWLINQEIVPSSKILQIIIDTLSSQQTQQLSGVFFKGFHKDRTKKLTWPQKPIPKEDWEMADAYRVDFSFQIDFSTIMNNIAQFMINF